MQIVANKKCPSLVDKIVVNMYYKKSCFGCFEKIWNKIHNSFSITSQQQKTGRLHKAVCVYVCSSCGKNNSIVASSVKTRGKSDLRFRCVKRNAIPLPIPGGDCVGGSSVWGRKPRTASPLSKGRRPLSRDGSHVGIAPHDSLASGFVLDENCPSLYS